MNTREIQSIQSDFDAKYREHNESIKKIEHIGLHAGKLLGKLCTYSEAVQHGQRPPLDTIRNEVIPDLVFYSAQLANLLDMDLGERLGDDFGSEFDKDISDDTINEEIEKITFEAGKTIGKLFSVSSIELDIQKISDVSTSFLFFASELAALLGENLETKYKERIEKNTARH